MKILFKDISERIIGQPKIEEISEKLFQLGHEHEIQEEIFDIEITPNRGDCLSVNGILRDLSVFYNIKNDETIFSKKLDNLELNFKNQFIDGCKKISFLKLEIDENILPYKGKLKRFFNDLDIKKNNFFTDISNYIAYETGQPTHCYDLNCIENELIFKEISHEQEFKTLLGKKIKLESKNAVFSCGEKVINLAGVMGDESTACSDKTRSVLVECAYFNPEIIAGKSVKYDLNSEAAYKFERGVDYDCHEDVLRRFVSLVEEYAVIKTVQFFSETYEDSLNKFLQIDNNKINKILGTDISDKLISDILVKLGFKYSNDKLIIPSFRNDVQNNNDIAEEIARVIGYDNIKLKKLKIFSEKSCDIPKIESSLIGLLVDNGFYEVINNPFVSGSKNDRLIKLDNPLDSNRQYLRNSLKESLINNLLYNERRQKDSVKLFEVSDIYNFDKDNKEFQFKRKIGIICSGRVDKNYKDFSKSIDKEYLIKTFNEYIPYLNKNTVEISRENLNTKNKNKIFYIELDIDTISKLILKYQPQSLKPKKYNIYKPISEYPSSIRDLSFSVRDFSQLEILEKYMLSFEHKDLNDVFVFDYFKNEEKNEIKIGFRFIFQSHSQTMKEEEVNNIINDIITMAVSLKKVSVPGLN